MNIAIDEFKLKELLVGKILKYQKLVGERAAEINKDVDYSDLSIGKEEYDALLKYLPLPAEEWPEGMRDQATDLINQTLEYAKRTDFKVATAKEIADILTVTEEEIANIAYDFKEIKE